MDAATPSPPSVGAPPSGRVLVYDGDCPLCVSGVRFLVGARIVPPERIRPFASFQGPLAGRLEAAGIRNEMATLDLATGELRSGAAGLLFGLEGTRLGWACRVIDRRPLRSLATGLYRLVSSNRRILAAPDPRTLPCACEPDDRPGLRWTLVALLYGFGALVAAAFGAVFLPEIGREAETPPALAMLAIAGAGQAVVALCALAVPRDRRGVYVAHLAATGAAGAALLLPATLVGALAHGHLVRAFFVFSTTASFLLMLGMQRRRVKFLRLTRGFVAAWIAALATGTASAWTLLLA